MAAPGTTTESVKQADWENPEVQRTGTEPPRASFFAFPNREKALRNEPEESEWILSLAGDWSFQWSPDPWSRPVDFYRADFDTSQWGLVESSFQLATPWVRRAPLHEHYVSLCEGSAACNRNAAGRIHELSLEKSGWFVPPHIQNSRCLVKPDCVSAL